MKRVLDWVDRVQRRRRWLAVPYAVIKRFGEHAGGRLAATISYWSFFSLFPLLLAFVTIFNIVVRDDPETRADLVDGALGQIPVIGTQLAATDHTLTGSPWAIAFGVGTAVWTGLAAASAFQVSLDEVMDIPNFDRANGAIKRLKSLAFLVVLAIGVAASTFAANLTAIFDSASVLLVVGLVATFVIDAAILLVAFRLLPSTTLTTKQSLPGILGGGFGLALLQLLGSWVVHRYIKGASDTYGTFAVVIALLSWFFLIARVALYAAQLNAVLTFGLSPRSMTPDGSITPADRRAAELNAKRVQDDRRVDVNIDTTAAR